MFALYRRLMRLYPASFRSRFADEMLQTIHDRHSFERRVGWPTAFADLFASAAVQRSKEMTGMKTKLGVLLLTVVGVGGGSMLVTGVSFGRSSLIVTLVALFAIGVIYGISTLIGSRRVGAEYDYSGRRFRWWWVPAALAGAVELFIGVGQLIDDPKIENVAALGIMGAFAGLVFGGMAIRNRIAGNWMVATGVLPMIPSFWMIVPPVLGLVVIVMALADNVRLSGRTRAAV